MANRLPYGSHYPAQGGNRKRILLGLFVITPIRHEDRQDQFIRRRQEAVRGTLIA